ncbi:hypothetical protein Q5424_13510 [Conexibacter sp. JD483]|uniref:hypothetical protein n=1 Tax=unclassified Conexibacter TaxID=2627773 RepID=UPI00271BAF1F|nr:MULTISPECIES: hypothetical protein [unclassified Conexibacter]MDO8184616.1 hypothetical protein [Conexibacter sp. CPCC 205706]MDO8197922.1 hypothetical protein [Conexibacter sp. CPCC 205762]MDR9370113.1 hypothetical protein [Conexibacter sp. JD483]
MSALRQTPASASAVSFPRVLRSEWIKLRSLRSTTLTLAAGLAAMVGMAVMVGLIRNHQWATMSDLQRQSVSVSYDVHVGGRFLGQLLLGVAGVLVVTGEYATGMIRATLAAVPRRLPVLTAKLTLLTLVLGATTLAASFAAWFLGSAVMSAHWHASLSDPGVLRAVVGQAVVLTATALLGASLGFLLRNTAAAIATLFGIVLVLPIVGELWTAVAPYLPSNALESVALARPDPDALAPGAGLLLFAAFTAVVLAGGIWSLLRKDA